jgi:phage terminase large subunit GpA-like protein
MTIEAVCVRVREHPHEKRTFSGVVSWTERAKRDRDGEMTRQKKGKECDQIFITEARILSVFSEGMICLWHFEEEIAIL